MRDDEMRAKCEKCVAASSVANDASARTITRSGVSAWPPPAAYWMMLWVGTMAAAAVYGFPFAGVGAILGFILAVGWGMLIVGPTAVCLRTLTGSWYPPIGGPAVGGLIGLASYALVDVLGRGQGAGQTASILLLGPATTITLGQVGAHLFGRMVVPKVAAAEIAPSGNRARRGFSLRSLFVFATWTGVFVAAVKGLRGFEPERSLVVSFGLAWYAVSLAAWAWLLRALPCPPQATVEIAKQTAARRST